MYICDECDFYFEDELICPKCGSSNISKAKENPKMDLEDDILKDLVFNDAYWYWFA